MEKAADRGKKTRVRGGGELADPGWPEVDVSSRKRGAGCFDLAVTFGRAKKQQRFEFIYG